MYVNSKSISILTLTPLLLLQTNDQRPSAPTGYYISSEWMTLELPRNEHESRNEGAYYLIFQRRYSNSEEEQLLKIAEATYPKREVMSVAIEAAPHGLDPIPEVEDLWWYAEYNDVRVPYAITGKSANFFLTLYKQITGQKWESGYPRCTFRYHARINQMERYAIGGNVFQNVYVVRMNLEWRLVRGPRSAIHFEKERMVILDVNHNVLGVFGDWYPTVMIS